MRGFGMTLDLTTGRMRHWYAGSDGIRRWVDNDKPCDDTAPDGLEGE